MPEMGPPLDEKYISLDGNNSLQSLPALHPRWKVDMHFLTYLPPPLSHDDPASWEEWLERGSFLEKDLRKLLCLPHDKFWCQVVFDETLQACVDSYCKNAPRTYDVVYKIPHVYLELHNSLHKLFFLVSLRMTTHKESKDHYITPKVFGDILYENFIFDIPKLMDLCVLYGADNSLILGKMISNVFTQQPKYEDDLQAIMPTILQVFDTILDKCDVKSDSAPSTPQKLYASSTKLSVIAMSLSEFEDILLYLSDTANTLQAFIEVYPRAAHAFHMAEFTTKIASTYGGLVSSLTEAMHKRTWDCENKQAHLQTKLRQSQVSLIKVFRAIVFHICLKPILEEESAEEVDLHVEDYLQLMSSLLAERRFVAHLEMLYPFSNDCDIIEGSCSVDKTRIQFIQDGIEEACQTFCNFKNKSRNDDSNDCTGEKSQTLENDAYLPLQVTKEERESDVILSQACKPSVDPVELESMISAVKDVLPDLGDGFVELCLEEMNFKTETVIDSILENNLPEALRDLERTMDRMKRNPTPSEDSLLSQRRNVFDNDEFDIFSRDKVDVSKIYQGKKAEHNDANNILNDKSDVSELKPLYQRYGNEFTESMYDAVDEYDDEYDDTYDSNLVGAKDEDSADELTSKRVLKPAHNYPSPDEKDSGSISEESDTEGSSSRDEFVPNPENLREKQAARQAQKQAEYERRHVRRQAQPRREQDVRGNPRGQGQSADVTRSRQSKEKNKSTRVHHNRRVLADKKRRV